ncbi:MAG: hypothetical protein HY661_14975 [Betaproteobacteria bacterium]|nr:hypothetical protein [Betaproteobacteria bacterium]
MAAKESIQSGAGQVVVLVVVAALLAIAYVALDFFTAGEKNIAITESRGMQMIQALSKHRLDAGSYPDSLDKLVPKYISAQLKCPGGETFAYNLAGGEFTLVCPNVVFKMKPYSYGSKTRAWQG